MLSHMTDPALGLYRKSITMCNIPKKCSESLFGSLHLPETCCRVQIRVVLHLRLSVLFLTMMLYICVLHFRLLLQGHPLLLLPRFSVEASS